MNEVAYNSGAYIHSDYAVHIGMSNKLYTENSPATVLPRPFWHHDIKLCFLSDYSTEAHAIT